MTIQKGEFTDLFIEKFSFWPNLSEIEKIKLTENTRVEKYEKGRTIYGGDSDCIGLMLVKKGQLHAYTLSDDGRQVTLYRLYPGDVGVLTVSCVLDQITFKVFMDADEDTEILLTSAPVFRQLAEENIYVKCFGYEMATARLSSMLWTMQQVLFLSTDKRLALVLLNESEKLGTDRLKLTQEQIAHLMGSAREVVSRLLKDFSGEGMVESGRGTVRILDREKLERLAR